MSLWKCENCGKDNRGDRNHCWSCASPKGSLAETTPTSGNVGNRVAAATLTPSESGTSRCNACGNDIEHGRGHAWNCTNSRVRDDDEVFVGDNTRSRSPFIKRYVDLYRTAQLLIGLGTTVKTVGIVAAIIVFLFWFIVGLFTVSQTSSPLGPSGSQSGAETVTFFVCIITGAVFGALVGGLFFLLGVLISAQGQLLMAHADSAVHTSPFLTNDEKASAMSLPFRAPSNKLDASGGSAFRN